MAHPEAVTTLGTQDTGRRQTEQNNTKNKTMQNNIVNQNGDSIWTHKQSRMTQVLAKDKDN